MDSQITVSSADDEMDDSNQATSYTIGAILWRRFLRNRMVIISLAVLGVIVLLTLAAPLIAPNPQFKLKSMTQLSPFFFTTYDAPSFDNFPLRIFGITSIYDLKRPILPAVLYGGGPVLLLGIGGALLTMVIGTIIGGISGYFGGRIDDALSWFINLIGSLPYLPFMLALIVAAKTTNGGVMTLIIVAALVGWPSVARHVRTNFLVQREQTYVEAAQAAGISEWRIIFRQMLPNAIGPILAQTMSNAASFMLAEAALSFIGVDIVNQVTWGQTIALGFYYGFEINFWWWWFFPTLFLILTILALLNISEGVRDAFDVRERLIH
jgi:ABC-type dipeptide/oligopeptide/nickel transport system permease subunit